MHTVLGPWRMRSSGAHCDRILAVEVQRCTLRSGAGEEDWRDTWRRGAGEAELEEEKKEKKKEEEKEF